MSLLNQMLKDLEQRQAVTPGNPVTQGVRSVATDTATGRTPVFALAGVAVAVLALAGGGYYAWNLRAAAPVAPPAPSVAEAPPPAPPVSPAVPDSAPAAVTGAPVAEAAPAEPARAETPLPAPLTAQHSASSPPLTVQGVAPAVTPAPTPPSGALAASTKPKGRVEKTESPRQRAERLHQTALARLQEGQWDEGLLGLQAALAADPGWRTSRHSLALLLMQNRDVAAAQTLLRDGLQQHPGDPGLSQLMGRLQLEQGRSAEAEKWLRQGLQQAPNDALLNGLLGSALREQGQHAEAVRHFLRALGPDPSMPQWLMGVALSWEALGQRADAREALERALQSGRLGASTREWVEGRLLKLQP